jgi:hypothetical protein
LQIWGNAPQKGFKGKHDPEGDTEALAIYDRAINDGVTERMAKAAAVEFLGNLPHRKNMEKASNQKRIRTLLSERANVTAQERKRHRLIKAYFPVLLDPDNKD